MSECLKTISDRDLCIHYCSGAVFQQEILSSSLSVFGFALSESRVESGGVDGWSSFPYPYFTSPLCSSTVDKTNDTEVQVENCSCDFWVPSTVSFLVRCKRPSTSVVPKNLTQEFLVVLSSYTQFSEFNPNPGIISKICCPLRSHGLSSCFLFNQMLVCGVGFPNLGTPFISHSHWPAKWLLNWAVTDPATDFGGAWGFAGNPIFKAKKPDRTVTQLVWLKIIHPHFGMYCTNILH